MNKNAKNKVKVFSTNDLKQISGAQLGATTGGAGAGPNLKDELGATTKR